MKDYPVARWILAAFFIAAGINHFRVPQRYIAIIPPYIPDRATANVISGAAEIAGGLGILVPATRKAAGWGLIALLVAVFPANVHMAQNGVPGIRIPTWMLWMRLPLQIPLILWVHRVCIKRPKS